MAQRSGGADRKPRTEIISLTTDERAVLTFGPWVDRCLLLVNMSSNITVSSYYAGHTHTLQLPLMGLVARSNPSPCNHNCLSCKAPRHCRRMNGPKATETQVGMPLDNHRGWWKSLKKFKCTILKHQAACDKCLCLARRWYVE